MMVMRSMMARRLKQDFLLTDLLTETLFFRKSFFYIETQKLIFELKKYDQCAPLF